LEILLLELVGVALELTSRVIEGLIKKDEERGLWS
jgi:hypothetical protein